MISNSISSWNGNDYYRFHNSDVVCILEVELYDQYFDGDSEKLRLFIVHVNDFKRSCELESGLLRDMCRP